MEEDGAIYEEERQIWFSVGGDVDDFIFFLSGSPEICCILWITETIHHPMVTNSVPGAEIFVGGVISHAPLYGSNVVAVFLCVIYDSCMSQCMLLSSLPSIEGLGGEHMAVGF